MRFTIIGTEIKTGREVDFQLQADSPDAALLEAQNKGILVRTIEPIADVPEQIIPSPVIALDYQPAIDEYPIKSRWIWVASFLGLELISGVTLFILLSGHTVDPIAFAQFVFFAVIFLSLQFATMLPVIRPRPAPGPGKPALLWIGAAATGLLLGLLVMGTLFMAADFLWSFDISNSAHDNLAISAIIFSGIFWLVSIPLIVMFMRRRRTESFLARLAAALFLGSLVEFLAAIPLLELVKRKESCTCATFTFFSMMLSCTVGFIVLGPMILLILFSRRTRAASRGFCPVCGFAMHAAGNPEKCPACGAGWKPTPLATS